jgi:hypothetical protein
VVEVYELFAFHQALEADLKVSGLDHVIVSLIREK